MLASKSSDYDEPAPKSASSRSLPAAIKVLEQSTIEEALRENRQQTKAAQTLGAFVDLILERIGGLLSVHDGISQGLHYFFPLRFRQPFIFGEFGTILPQ